MSIAIRTKTPSAVWDPGMDLRMHQNRLPEEMKSLPIRFHEDHKNQEPEKDPVEFWPNFFICLTLTGVVGMMLIGLWYTFGGFK